MPRKIISIVGIALLLCILQNCTSHPEEGLLKRYFSALSLNDRTTLSTMALEPISIEFQSWEITNVTEEIVEPYKLPEMDKKEKELKKKLEGHVGPVLDAEDAVYVADDKIKNARTRAARRAAQREKEEAQAKFEEEREIHRQMQKEYNEAEDQARREEEIASFSLGIGNLPNIRDLSGETFAKQVDVETTGESGTKEYRFYLRRYVLTDETLDITHRGRWIIVKIEAIS